MKARMTAALGAALSLALAAAASAKTIEVRPDDNSLKPALSSAEPGDEILLHKGVYEGRYAIARSGTKESPITIKAFGDGPAVMKGELPTFPAEYSGGCPKLERTFSIVAPAGNKMISDIVVDGIEFDGGIFVGLSWSPNAWKDFYKKMCEENVDAKGEKIKKWGDIMNAMKEYFVKNKIPYENRPEILGCSAKRIVIKNCTLTRRGAMYWHASDCLFENNTVKITEKTILGFALQEACFNNVVRGNDISGMHSPVSHWHGEGIRVVNHSCNNLVENNHVYNVRGAGFGITGDVYADGNTYKNNLVENIESIAFTDQCADSDNKWIGNTAKNCAIGYDFASFWWEYDMEKSNSHNILVADNKSIDCKFSDCTVSWIKSITFKNNDFKRLNFSPNFIAYWPKSGNTWNGSKNLPPEVSTDKASRFVKLF